MHAYVYTPRRQHVLFPRSKPRFTFSPAISADRYVAPPPPPPLKRLAPPKASNMGKDELRDAAQRLRTEAEQLEIGAANTSKPPVSIQLGLMLRRDDYIKRIIKEWDPKGKGELMKAEFRLHLRNFGLQATSAEADALFDSWDDDKGGALDMKELKAALIKTQNKARQWEVEQKNDPRIARAKALREHAVLADNAAIATEEAEVSSLSLHPPLPTICLFLTGCVLPSVDTRGGVCGIRARIGFARRCSAWLAVCAATRQCGSGGYHMVSC